MTEDNPLYLWRLAADLSVEDVAILIAGGDPSAVDGKNVKIRDADYAHDEIFPVVEWKETKRTTGHPGFVASFTGLKAAVICGSIPATFQYVVKPASDLSQLPLDDFFITTTTNLKPLLSTPESKLDELLKGSIAITKEPDWSRTYVNVEDVKKWLRQRGFKNGFFLTSMAVEPDSLTANAVEPDDFTDQSYEHFAPELALAVAAWRALSQDKKFKSGPKNAISKWIEANPNEWRGKNKLSESAKERIITLVNWNQTGGAPKSGA